MTATETQAIMKIETPLGDASMRLVGIRGREAMSELFEYELDLVSRNSSISAGDLVGQPVTFALRLADDSFRPFHGFVKRFFADDESDKGFRSYRLVVVPWLWMLTCSSDCRIFQKKKVDEILREVFETLEFSDFEIQLQARHPKQEYCVQYRESDFEFISRLMQEEGIFYFFRHEEDRHVMVIADKPSVYFDCEEREVDYPRDSRSIPVEDHLKSWEHRYDFRPGRWSQTDFDFENPDNSLMTSTGSAVKLSGNSRLERYDYPGSYLNTDDGRALTDLRIEEEEARHDVVRGTSTCRSFAVGGKFKVRQHRCGAEGGKGYVITAIEHEARETNPYDTFDDAVVTYHNAFRCVPHATPARPRRRTKRPFVRGVQTAIVVGPPGEEIYTDPYGRVKVQFHWDRQGKRDENSSCWVRVSQAHAGTGYGVIDIPRVGDEVIVSFLEGDPNRPIITGRVYHARNMPPYALPGDKTITGIRSKTYKGDGYNEMIVDDSPGKELIRIHAQFDMDTTVLNDQRENVKRDRTRTVGRDETVTIDRDRTETIWNRDCQKVAVERDVWIGAGFNTFVGGEMNELVVVSRSEETLGFKTEYVGAFVYEEIRRSRRTKIGKDVELFVGRHMRETVDGQRTTTVKKDVVETFDADHHETVANEYKLMAKEIHLVGKEAIVLKVGDTVIRLTPEALNARGDDTEIGGNDICIGSQGGGITVHASAALDMSGERFSLEGKGDGKINAGMVKINC